MSTLAGFLWVCRLLSAGLFAATVETGTAVQVTKLDGQRLAGALVRIGPDEVYLSMDGAAQTLPRNEVSRIEFVKPAPAAHRVRAYSLYLADGGVIGAEVLDAGEEAMVVRTRLAERLTLPFAKLAAIERTEADAPAARNLLAETLADRVPGKDVLITADAQPQTIRGTLTRWGPRHGEFVFNDRPRTFEVARTYGVVFAAGAAPAAPAARITVTMADGEQFTATDLTVAEGKARLATSLGVTVEIDVDALRSLTWTNPRVVYLSDLEPVAYHYTGVVHAEWPYRRDRNAFNGPLTLGGKRYAKGLGMHAESELSFDIAKAYETFAATIGIDDAASAWGVVEFYLIGDGKPLFASGPVRGDDPPRDVQVPVSGVERLTLRVDFAENADVGDWANWASARLIKAQDRN